jgi:receptor protein-tyrosine kinase
MTAERTLIPGLMPTQAEDARRLALFLQRFTRISAADLARAVELQRQGELRFSEAIRQLGLATPALLDAALSYEGDPNALQLPRPAGLLRIAHDPAHPHSERLRALRTEVLQRTASSPGLALAVVSCAPGEGRSVLAAELAIAFAQLDQPTLLIDADLRRPAQQQFFAADNRRGLAQLAAGDASCLQAVEGLPQLALLTAGAAMGNPQDALAGPRFGHWLSLARQRYRYIVLDTPAADGNADALALAGHVDAVLPLARRHHTPLPQFKALISRLRGSAAQVLGSVLMEF